MADRPKRTSKRTSKSRRPRITLVQSDDPKKVVREMASSLVPKGNKRVTLREVEVWVRQPDSERLEEITAAARLCRCRSVCLAVIEDELLT